MRHICDDNNNGRRSIVVKEHCGLLWDINGLMGGERA